MNKSYTALIVEDIQDTSDFIRQRLCQLLPQLNPIHQAYNIDEAYGKILSTSIDIVFLDIQLSTGTGFDLLKRLSEEGNINFEIIFITGESAKEYTLRAIKYSAIDFLYKPLDDTELMVAVNKALDKLNQKKHNRQIQLLLERISESSSAPNNKIAFHLHNGIIEFIDITEIKYLQADGVITYVYLNNDKKLAATKNLGFYKDMLINDYSFHSISNSLLVNGDYIKRYDHRQLVVTLTDGTYLYASKRFGKDFKDQFTSKVSFAGIRNTLKEWWGK